MGIKSRLKLFEIVSFLILWGAMSPAVLAMDRQGNFVTGGGAGMTGCPIFLNAMATARQRGGTHTIEGIREINSYIHYVLGFQTGFNAEAAGIYDIFASLGENPAVKALYAIEPWCAQNPDKKFGTALRFLAHTLRNKLKEN